MKKYIFLLLASCNILFQACDKDDNNEPPAEKFTPVGLIDKITITEIANSSPYISEVAFVSRVHVPAGAATAKPDNTTSDQRYMLRIPFNEKEMILLLPANPPQTVLCNITGDIPKGLEISDPEANTVSFVEIGCCSAGSDHIMGQLIYRKHTERIYYYVQYIYSDRFVKVTGSAKDWWGHPATYDLILEKGWNMVVEKKEYSGDQQILTVSNLLPEGMEWNYEMWL